MRNSQVDWLLPHIHCDNNKYFIHTVAPRYNEGQGLAIFVRYDEVSLYRGTFPYILLLLG